MLFKSLIKPIFILIFILLRVNTYAQYSTDESALMKFYKEKAKTYLLKDSLNDYNQLALKKEGVFFYKDSLKKRENEFNYFISWKSLENLKEDFEKQPYDSLYKKFLTDKKYTINQKNKINENSQIKKIKVAISPGHLATSFNEAKYEEKYIEFNNGKAKFYEADLNLETALILKKKLLKKGFDVFLTRTEKKADIWSSGFFEWKTQKFDITLKENLESGEFSKEQVEWFKKEATEQQIFKYLYAKYELRERAKIINEFNPDITIAIHYNVDEKNKGWKTTSNKNYIMAFVPGSFLKSELEKPLDQFNFLRLLVTDNINNSIHLSKEFINSFFKISSIPIAKKSDAVYLENFCLTTEERGVFSRNLAMTRLVNSPILYGEPLYQDNKKMSRSLNLHNPDRNKKRTSKYVKKVAKSYYKSILNYIKYRHTTKL